MTSARVWKLGADVDTDALAPGAYMKHGIDVIAQHCLEALRPDFAAAVRPGDVLWGCVRSLRPLSVACFFATLSTSDCCCSLAQQLNSCKKAMPSPWSLLVSNKRTARCCLANPSPIF